MRNFFHLALFTCLTGFISAHADQLRIISSGQVKTGQILKVEEGFVTIQTASGTVPFPLVYVDNVVMSPPDDYTRAQGADPTTTISLLQPLVQKFQGLPVEWVVSAMVQLADAYIAQKNNAPADLLYTQIDKLYSGSIYGTIALSGKARSSLASGKVDEAATLLQPALEAANKTLLPSAPEAAIYARAFLVEGQILEAKKQYAQALEAYLTVKTLFYQNPTLVTEASTRADKLLASQPGLNVD